MKENLKILILEDSSADAELAQYHIKQAGIHAVFTRVEKQDDFARELKDGGYDLILSDYTLPAYDGRWALDHAKRLAPGTPFIFVTGTLGEELAIDLLKSGATDYILKNRLPKLGSAVKRALLEHDERLERLKAELNLRETVLKLRKMTEGTIQAMAATTELRDPYTAGHQRRVAVLSSAIAGLLKDKGVSSDALIFAGTIHDIGKIVVPTDILNKIGKLSLPEHDMLKTHPQAGYDILKHIQFPWPIADIILQHHERLDGTGYPARLKGSQIITEAKIIAVADVVESMAFARPYRPALGLEQAFGEIEGNKGNLYDPDIVDACVSLFRDKGFSFDKAEQL